MVAILEREQIQSKYQHIESEIGSDLAADTYVSLARSKPWKVYSLGFQPAKSIPEISSWFLKKYMQADAIILDPFAGSGTTVIQSIAVGMKALWLDYHPLSQILCRVKTSSFSCEHLRDDVKLIAAHAARAKSAPETVQFANKDFWFQKPAQDGLELLRAEIREAPPKSQPVLWLAFSSTVRKVSNMNDGMLLAARRPNIKDIPIYSRADVIRHFVNYAEKAIEALDEWKPIVERYHPGNIMGLPIPDARELVGDRLCDAIVTSPPYINAIDYVWASKFELHWLGLVHTDQERLDLYAKEIGTERISAKERRELGRTGNSTIDQLVEDIFVGKRYQASKGQNQLRARVVYKYFMDMKQHFTAAFAAIKLGGYYCFTIGDQSRICGVEIPVASILSELASEAGFREHFKFHLLLKNRRLNIPRNVDWAGTIKHDTTIVLERPA